MDADPREMLMLDDDGQMREEEDPQPVKSVESSSKSAKQEPLLVSSGSDDDEVVDITEQVKGSPQAQSAANPENEDVLQLALREEEADDTVAAPATDANDTPRRGKRRGARY